PDLTLLRLADLRSRNPGGYPLADLRRSIGHRTHDQAVLQRARYSFDPGAGHNGEDQLTLFKNTFDLAEYGTEALRLNGQNHNRMGRPLIEPARMTKRYGFTI